MIIIFIILVFIIEWSLGGYVAMTCGITDASERIDLKNAFLSGEYSFNNNIEWRYCKTSNDDDNPYNGVQKILPQININDKWIRQCNGNSALNYVSTKHKKDDKITFSCINLKNGYYLVDCFWGEYVSNINKRLNYHCPDNGLIKGIQSFNNNGFKFECCRLISTSNNISAKAFDNPINNNDSENSNNITTINFILIVTLLVCLIIGCCISWMVFSSIICQPTLKPKKSYTTVDTSIDTSIDHNHSKNETKKLIKSVYNI